MVRPEPAAPVQERPAAGGLAAASAPQLASPGQNEPLERAELEAIHTCVKRGRPYGTAEWVAATAARLGLGFTLRGAGRPPQAGRNNENEG